MVQDGCGRESASTVPSHCADQAEVCLPVHTFYPSERDGCAVSASERLTLLDNAQQSGATVEFSLHRIRPRRPPMTRTTPRKSTSEPRYE